MKKEELLKLLMNSEYIKVFEYIQELEKENKQYEIDLEIAGKAVEDLIDLTDSLKNNIQELEKENDRTKYILENNIRRLQHYRDNYPLNQSIDLVHYELTLLLENGTFKGMDT